MKKGFHRSKWHGLSLRFMMVGGLLSLAGCATVPVKGGFAEVQEKVAPRVSQQIHWNQGGPEDEAVAAGLSALLGAPLTLSGVLQVALINNPTLQARYEGLGIAQADLVQAGLLENPVFGATVGLPDHDRSRSERSTVTRDADGAFSLSRSAESAVIQNNIEFALVQNFLDVLTLPLQKKMASAHFEQAKLAVSHDIVAFVAALKHSYYDYVAALQQLELLRSISVATGAASEFAVRQYEAGNLSRLDMARENAFHGNALLDVAEAELECTIARERMNRLMGWWERSVPWTLADSRLPVPTAPEPDLEGLASFAIAHRLDLAEAVKELEVLAFGAKTTRQWRWLGLLDLSVATERDGDGVYVTGPSLELQLPLFDQGQSKIAISESQWRAGSQRVSARAIAVRSEARESWATLHARREQVDFFQRVMLPTQQTILDESQLHYNAMLVGVYDLLLDKQQQIDVARRYVAALRAYWIAHSDLELALGGAFPGAASDTVLPPLSPAPAVADAGSTEARPTHDHENHLENQ